MRWNHLLFLLVVLTVVLLTTAPVAAGKNYTAERYDVSIVVAADGDLAITESVRFRFEGGPFTYVFRELERRNLDAIEILRLVLAIELVVLRLQQ